MTVAKKGTGRHRADGEGSIFEDKVRGGYIASVSIHTPDGRRLKRRRRARTEAEAVTALNALRAKYADGVGLDDRQTVAQFLNAWLRDASATDDRLRPSTARRYEQIIRVHLVPGVGRHGLARLTPQHVNAMLRGLAEAGRSARTRQHVRATLRTALADAMRWGLIRTNAAALATPPRGASKEIEVITREDAKAILDSVQGDRLEALYVVALSLGLRQGEALGLRWSDVDLDASTLTVRRALQKVKRGDVQKYELVEPKTRRSRRTIALPAPTVVALTAHRERQREEQRQGHYEVRGREWDLVFTDELGRPLHGPTVTRHLQALLTTKGLKRRRFHDLRHACATLLLAQGVPARVVMETLGHSTIAVTMNIYTHVMPELQRDAADRMGAFLTGSEG